MRKTSSSILQGSDPVFNTFQKRDGQPCKRPPSGHCFQHLNLVQTPILPFLGLQFTADISICCLHKFMLLHWMSSMRGVRAFPSGAISWSVLLSSESVLDSLEFSSGIAASSSPFTRLMTPCGTRFLLAERAGGALGCSWCCPHPCAGQPKE